MYAKQESWRPSTTLITTVVLGLLVLLFFAVTFEKNQELITCETRKVRAEQQLQRIWRQSVLDERAASVPNLTEIMQRVDQNILEDISIVLHEDRSSFEMEIMLKINEHTEGLLRGCARPSSFTISQDLNCRTKESVFIEDCDMQKY
jgi:N-glycosylase/DNA lyase